MLAVAVRRRARVRTGRGRALAALAADVVVPLASYYGARLLGADALQALFIGAGLSIAVAAFALIRRRRVDRVVLPVLGLLVVGTVVGLIVDEPRAMMARGAWVTGVIGVWITATCFTARPLLFDGTLRLMPQEGAAEWRRQWVESRVFRRLLRRMTAGFGVAFLLDAAARIAMAWTLPLDVVPALSSVLLVAMLTLVVAVGRLVGRRTLRGMPRTNTARPPE